MRWSRPPAGARCGCRVFRRASCFSPSPASFRKRLAFWSNKVAPANFAEWKIGSGSTRCPAHPLQPPKRRRSARHRTPPPLSLPPFVGASSTSACCCGCPRPSSPRLQRRDRQRHPCQVVADRTANDRHRCLHLHAIEQQVDGSRDACAHIAWPGRRLASGCRAQLGATARGCDRDPHRRHQRHHRRLPYPLRRKTTLPVFADAPPA